MRKKITNEHYKEFLEKGQIRIINETDIKTAIAGIDHDHKDQAANLLIVLYYTGARPNEVLNLRAKDITLEGSSYVCVSLKGSKGGLPRKIRIQYKRPLAKSLYRYAQKLIPEQYLYWYFRSEQIKTHRGKNGTKTYIVTTTRLYYHIRKWLKPVLPDGIPPYFLRHSRFSGISERGGSMEDIMHMKGSKTMSSVRPYLHMSKDRSKKLARINI